MDKLTPEDLAALHPELFRTSQPAPFASFAEQHAFAINARREPRPPAACSLLAEQMARQSRKALTT